MDSLNGMKPKCGLSFAQLISFLVSVFPCLETEEGKRLQEFQPQTLVCSNVFTSFYFWIFVFGVELYSVMPFSGRLNRSAKSMGVPRLFPCAEIFGGVGEISQSDGFVFESRRCRSMNFHSYEGMCLLARNLAMVDPQGFAVIEPTCSSFLSFVSAATAKRSDEP